MSISVRLPDGEGVSVCRDVRSAVSPPPACLMLTSFSDDEALFGAIMAGAAGYLLKQVTGTDLIGAVRTVARADPCSTRGRRRWCWSACVAAASRRTRDTRR